MGETDRLAQCAPLESWADFDVIHLACHGRFIADSPLDTSLYLGGEALRASEFFGVKLKSEVVCFSACDVGQQIETLEGLAVTSDEWVGLSLPLFQSGARTLLFSLWEANSEIAREFMEVFHAGLARGLDPPRAHRQACLSQVAKERPYGFWANWQLVGFPFGSAP
jgi:CHAT domain-containing protein